MANSTETPLEISGYFVLPLSLPPLPAFPTAATHFLYLKKHQPKIPTATSSRSLFVANVPFDATEISFKRLFSTQLDLPNGRIENVEFEDEKRKAQDQNGPHSQELTAEKSGKKRKRPRGNDYLKDMGDAKLPSTWDRELREVGRSAVVLFVDQVSVDAVIRAIKKTRKEKKNIVWGGGMEDAVPLLGPSRYLTHQRRQYPDKTQLLESVNAFMTAFAAQEASQVRLQTKRRQVPDEDGFITVTKGGRNGPARQEAAQEQAEKQKQKHKGLEDFYRFQTREKRKEKAGELLRKFEDDKEKIRRMREKRTQVKS